MESTVRRHLKLIVYFRRLLPKEYVLLHSSQKSGLFLVSRTLDKAGNHGIFYYQFQ